MPSSIESNLTSSSLDVAKLALAGGMVVLGLVAFYYYAAYPQYLRVGGIVADVAVALVIASKTNLGGLAFAFIGESKIEVRKVVWPSKQETLQSTLIVCLLVLVVGIFLWLLDMLLFWGVGILTGQKV